jgi:RNAse (barnase) inhibitor barstar
VDEASTAPVLVIDGSTFDDFAGFQRAFSSFLVDYEWHGNLDAFNDLLRGGFGTPEGGFVLRWLHSERSREALGYGATVALLQRLSQTCHPNHVPRVQAELQAARDREGPTLFDDIVKIIKVHGPGGEEAEDGVILELL